MKKANPKRLTNKQMAVRMREMLEIGEPCSSCPASSPEFDYDFSCSPSYENLSVCRTCRKVLDLDPSSPTCPCYQIKGDVTEYVLKTLKRKGL